MDKGKRALVAVLIDFVMLALIVFSVYMLLFKADTPIMKNIFTGVIVIAIPVMFYATYMAAAGNKFEYNEDEFEDDSEDNDTLDIGKSLKENDSSETENTLENESVDSSDSQKL